jgi:hypothetical protein
MNRTLFNVSNINKWNHFLNDYNIIRINPNLRWMNVINTDIINDEIENNYLSQMAFMHSRSYLIGYNINQMEEYANEEDEYLDDMSVIHSRCEKHA